MSADAGPTESFDPVSTPMLTPAPGLTPGSGLVPGRAGWRRELLPLVGLLILGVLVAVVWRGLTPHTVKLGDDDEASAAVDGTLALLGVLVGVLPAVLVLLWPGRSPIARTVSVMIGSVLGAVLSWKLGDQLGTPHLRATGAAFVWPTVTAAVLFVGALLPGTSRRLQPPEPRPDPVPYSPGPFSGYRSG